MYLLPTPSAHIYSHALSLYIHTNNKSNSYDEHGSFIRLGFNTDDVQVRIQYTYIYIDKL